MEKRAECRPALWYKYHDAADEEQVLTGEALTVATLMLKGVESYIAFNPVITRNSTYKTRPTPADYGKICTPPVTAPGMGLPENGRQDHPADRRQIPADGAMDRRGRMVNRSL